MSIITDVLYDSNVWNAMGCKDVFYFNLLGVDVDICTRSKWFHSYTSFGGCIALSN